MLLLRTQPGPRGVRTAFFIVSSLNPDDTGSHVSKATLASALNAVALGVC